MIIMKLIRRVWDDAWFVEKVLIVVWTVDLLYYPFTSHVNWWLVAFDASMLVHVVRTIMIRKVVETLNILLKVIKSGSKQ